MKKRTIDDYKKAGAMFRLMNQLSVHLLVGTASVTKAAERRKIRSAMSRINQVRSDIEDRMFHEHPELSNDYLSVFYGSTLAAPRNSVDEEVLSLVEQQVNHLVNRNSAEYIHDCWERLHERSDSNSR